MTNFRQIHKYPSLLFTALVPLKFYKLTRMKLIDNVNQSLYENVPQSYLFCQRFFLSRAYEIIYNKMFWTVLFSSIKLLQTTAISILCQTVYRLQLQLFISCSRCRQPSSVLPLISMQHCFTTIYSQRSLSSFQWSCALAVLFYANISESSWTTKKRFTHSKIYYIFSNIHYYSFSRLLFKHFFCWQFSFSRSKKQ